MCYFVKQQQINNQYAKSTVLKLWSEGDPWGHASVEGSQRSHIQCKNFHLSRIW